MGVRRGDEVALKRIPICQPERDTFRGILDMIRSRDVYEFQRALGGWSFPSANCVFGDRKGNIGYKTILSLPIRSAHSLLDDRAAHEGWDSDNDWQGFVPHELLPQVINPEQGWLVSANHRPIASFYPLSLGISTGSLGDTDRSWRLKERVRAKESSSRPRTCSTSTTTRSLRSSGTSSSWATICATCRSTLSTRTRCWRWSISKTGGPRAASRRCRSGARRS